MDIDQISPNEAPKDDQDGSFFNKSSTWLLTDSEYMSSLLPVGDNLTRYSCEPVTSQINDKFVPLESGITNIDSNYQDLIFYHEYQEGLGSEKEGVLAQGDGGLQAFAHLGEVSSSEITASASAQESVSTASSSHSRSTSTGSQTILDFPPDLQISASSYSPAISPKSTIPEFENVIVADAAWPIARCNPPLFSGSCPRTAMTHLESLEQTSKLDDPWRSLETISQADFEKDSSISITQLTASTRDKILAITQCFLHKALDIHRSGQNNRSIGSPSSGGFNFLVLPPSHILEYFLRSSMSSLTPYYTLISGKTVDTNKLVLNNQASILLVLFMIAHGATAFPTIEARYLTAGLTETCRISLFDIIEKDVELSADPTVLTCALFFTILGAWR